MARRVHPDDLSEFGKKVEAWRQAYGISQIVLAQLIGTSQRTLSDWTRIDGMPGAVYQIARLAALMEQPVSGLVGDDACVAPLRDLEYVQRVLAQFASPTVVERYVKRRHLKMPRLDRTGGSS